MHSQPWSSSHQCTLLQASCPKNFPLPARAGSIPSSPPLTQQKFPTEGFLQTSSCWGELLCRELPHVIEASISSPPYWWLETEFPDVGWWLLAVRRAGGQLFEWGFKKLYFTQSSSLWLRQVPLVEILFSSPGYSLFHAGPASAALISTSGGVSWLEVTVLLFRQEKGGVSPVQVA